MIELDLSSWLFLILHFQHVPYKVRRGSFRKEADSRGFAYSNHSTALYVKTSLSCKKHLTQREVTCFSLTEGEIEG